MPRIPSTGSDHHWNNKPAADRLLGPDRSSHLRSQRSAYRFGRETLTFYRCIIVEQYPEAEESLKNAALPLSAYQFQERAKSLCGDLSLIHISEPTRLLSIS